MHTRRLRKADGRQLILYNRDERGPIDESIDAPSPNVVAGTPNSQLRWHPLRGEWVIYASHRQNRTFLPPKEYNPLLPTRTAEFPTELPQGRYDVAVFENLFPSLSSKSSEPVHDVKIPMRAGVGACEVVVFTQNPEASLGQLPLNHIELLLEVWAERSLELGARPEIEYVLPFENRGVEVGVTLHHPHGQIYAYPFVPPLPAREHAEALRFYQSHKRSILESMIEDEIQDGRRILYESEGAVAFVPACARYPYEVWVAPRKSTSRLEDLSSEQRRELSRALKTVLLKYDQLWKRPFPYLMAFHQAPSDGQEHPEIHMHLEFSPPYRSQDRLKYLAGTELAAGTFANDSLPEEKAAELRAVHVEIDDEGR